MLHLVLALLVFLILHLFPTVPGMREILIGRVGQRHYMIIHSAISTLTLLWVIVAALNAPAIVLWPAAGWQAWITVALSPFGLFFVIAGLLSPTPLSLSLRPASQVQSGISRITRHPVFFGALLWALSHILPNGDLRSMLLFGSMAALAVGGFALGDRRARRRLGPLWEPLASSTSIIPFLAIAQRRVRFKIDTPIIMAVLLAALITGWLLDGGHAALFGVDPMTATAD